MDKHLVLVVIVVVLVVGAGFALMLRSAGPRRSSTATNASNTTTPTSITTATMPSSTSSILASSSVEGRLSGIMVEAWAVDCGFLEGRVSYRFEGRLPANTSSVEEDARRMIMDSAARYGVNVLGLRVWSNLNPPEISLEFNATGLMWRSSGECYLDTSWILSWFHLDLIENHFTETRDSLEWRGEVNGIQVEVVFHLPAQKTVYKAWGSEIGHCHAHVWWPLHTS